MSNISDKSGTERNSGDEVTSPLSPKKAAWIDVDKEGQDGLKGVFYQ